jgi:hypothetical protein
VETLDAKWGRLASLTLRGLVAKKGTSYPQLAAALSSRGLKESWRSVEGKIQRGGYSFAFFLHCATAMNADCPDSWNHPLQSAASCTEAAAAIVSEEMSKVAGMSLSVLGERLAWIGVQMPQSTLESDISTGVLSFKLFLQCAAVLPVSNIARFVDASDLRALAAEGIAESKRAAPLQSV